MVETASVQNGQQQTVKLTYELSSLLPSRNVHVFAAFSEITVSGNAICISLSPTECQPTALSWDINTWENTQLRTATVTYIACAHLDKVHTGAPMTASSRTMSENYQEQVPEIQLNINSTTPYAFASAFSNLYRISAPQYGVVAVKALRMIGDLSQQEPKDRVEKVSYDPPWLTNVGLTI